MTENKRFNVLLSPNGRYKYINDKEMILSDRHGQIQGYIIEKDHEENVDRLVKFLNIQEQSIKEWEKSNNCYADKYERLEKENEQLKQEIKKLETFKKILDYAEKDMEERVDWQSYCEKEFEGL